MTSLHDLTPGVKLTDERSLYEIVETVNGKTLLEDCFEPVGQCSTVRMDSWRLCHKPYRLINGGAQT